MITEARETSKRAAARHFGVDTKRVQGSCVVPKKERKDGAGIYLAPLFNLSPRGAYSDAEEVVQQLHLSNTLGANMVICGTL